MPDLHTIHPPADRADTFRQSAWGYIVDPDGTILSLRELQVHGRISYGRSAAVRAHYDALDKDMRNRTMTSASTYAVEHLGEIRIGIWQGCWNLDWSRSIPITPEQFAALDFMAAVEGIGDDDEVMTGSGDGPWRSVRRRMTKPNWGFGGEADDEGDDRE